MCKYFINLNWKKLTENERYAKSFYFLTECRNCDDKFSCNQDKGMITRIGLAAVTTFDEYSFDELLEQAEDLEDLKDELEEAELGDDMSAEIDIPEDSTECLIDNYVFEQMCRNYQINKYEYKTISEYVLNKIIDKICYKHIDSMIVKSTYESGSYSHISKLIKINYEEFNKAFLEKESFVKLIKIILHESRHAWQYEKKWDFNDYIIPDLKMNYSEYVEAFKKYKNNKAEIDANKFADEQIKKIDLNDLCQFITSVIENYILM